MLVSVVRESEDRLHRDRWTFRLTVAATPRLRLCDYSSETRPSRRHRKWRSRLKWCHYGPPRLWTTDKPLPKPPAVPRDVIDEAIQQITAAIEPTCEVLP